MRTLKDIFFVKVDKRFNDTFKLGEKELFLDTDFDKYRHARQYGVITSVPHRITPKNYLDIQKTGEDYEQGFYYDTPLVIGDKVYFHHFVAGNDESQFTINDEKVFMCHYEQMYCVVRDGEIIPLERNMFCSQIMEDEKNYQKSIGGIILFTKPNPEPIKNYAKVEFLSEKCMEFGLRMGDTIIHKNDADYDITIEGTKYWKIDYNHINAVIRDGKIVPVGKQIIIKLAKLEDEERESGLIVLKRKEERQQKNVVFASADKEIKEGEMVYYTAGLGTDFEFNGEKYLSINSSRILLREIAEEPQMQHQDD